MSGKTKRQKLVIGAATLAICGTFAAGMTSEAPLILYPITPSLPPGLYVRTFEPPKVGMIAAFRVPETARLYKRSIGEDVHDDFLFMKPIVAGPGDHVCRQSSNGVFVNGIRMAPEITYDRSEHPLPLWLGCRRMLGDELFTLSRHSTRSFDSRHYGPIHRSAVYGTYRFWIWS